MRSLKDNNQGSAVPLILFIITLISCGALYTLFFIEVAYPNLLHFVPESDSKTFIMMCMYAIPLFVILLGVFSVVKEGIKESWRGMGYP